jgi:copper chaperone CopZ
MKCMAENILRAYHDGEVETVAVSEIEAHLASCATCVKHLEEIVTTSAGVRSRIASLDAGAAETSIDPRVALSRFKARHDAPAGSDSFVSRVLARRWRPVWATGMAATIMLCALAFPSGRSLAQRFLATLRIEKVQPVSLDFSTLDGNRPLGEMLSKMLSDKMVVTADEKLQDVNSVKDASELAGFAVQLIGARTDTPKFTVEGHHAFHMTVDRERLQDLVDQAGRPDLLVPAKIDGATVSVNVPRAVSLEYGECPHVRGDAIENGSAAHAKTVTNCVALIEAPVPQVNVPPDLNIQQLAEIGFQLTRMSPTQARELAQAIDWKSTLVLPIPRMAGTYTPVQVAGVQGTLINATGHRDPHYVLIWVKNGIIYGLVGHGDSSQAVTLANTLN